MQSIENLIEQMQLQPHPEGGYYRSTLRADDTLTLERSDHCIRAFTFYYDLRISHIFTVYNQMKFGIITAAVP